MVEWAGQRYGASGNTGRRVPFRARKRLEHWRRKNLAFVPPPCRQRMRGHCRPPRVSLRVEDVVVMILLAPVVRFTVVLEGPYVSGLSALYRCVVILLMGA